MAVVTTFWRRIDWPGHEAARLSPDGAGWNLTGTAVFATEDQPCCLNYSVRTDAGWRTLAGRVAGWIGSASIDVAVAVVAGAWTLNGVEVPAVRGCIDLDLNFSPATNLLPIRRLGLAVGSQAPVRAAWLRFPCFTLEPLDQVYHRTGEATYRYTSAGGAFVADLRVGEAGFVTEYPGLWQAEQSRVGTRRP